MDSDSNSDSDDEKSLVISDMSKARSKKKMPNYMKSTTARSKKVQFNDTKSK